jgi:FKBP-type peptidyl-prolyl cis-trans isomerase FkpA
MKLTFTTLACALTLALVQSTSAAADAAPTSLKPTSLKKTDTVVGHGALAMPGSTVTVHYTGWLFTPTASFQHGAQFDSSVGGQPFTFRLGSGKVIKGLDQGLEGMKVGGKRTLIVPAQQGYGSRGAGPIPPNANLIFDVELIEVK